MKPTPSVRVRGLLFAVGLALMLATLACVCSGGGLPDLGDLSNLTGGGNITTVDTPLGSGSSLTVANTGSTEICYVYISLPSEDTWGDDRLGSDQTISAGSSVLFNVAPGVYDVRAETCDGGYTEEYDYDINSPTTWSVSVTN